MAQFDKLIALVTKHAIDIRPVGSRVTCNPAPTDTDIDYLVWAEDATDYDALSVSDILQAACGDPEGGEYDTMSCFASYRVGNINFIVTYSGGFFRSFLAASAVCKRLNLMDKSDRIAVFRAVLYSEDCTPIEGEFFPANPDDEAPF